MKKFSLFCLSLLLTACGPSIKTERVSLAEGDERGLSITDEWVLTDTKTAVTEIMEKMEKHRAFNNWLSNFGKRPKVFIAEIQNDTSEAYFPIDDFNDEMLDRISEAGDFILIDNNAREKILKEVQYQNDGMVRTADIKRIGRQSGADVLIFGAIRMNPKTLGGQSLKEYTVNVRITDIETAEEIARVRTSMSKYSKRSGSAW